MFYNFTDKFFDIFQSLVVSNIMILHPTLPSIGTSHAHFNRGSPLYATSQNRPGISQAYKFQEHGHHKFVASKHVPLY